jgi:hypothetical protein
MAMKFRTSIIIFVSGLVLLIALPLSQCLAESPLDDILKRFESSEKKVRQAPPSNTPPKQRESVSSKPKVDQTKNLAHYTHSQIQEMRDSSKIPEKVCTNELLQEPLKSWREAYDLRSDVVPKGVYRIIYTARRVAISESGRICECSFKELKFGDGTQRKELFAKNVGSVQSDDIEWTEMWIRHGDLHKLLPGSKLYTIWKDGRMLKPLMLERMKDGCFFVAQLNADFKMSADEVCACNVR